MSQQESGHPPAVPSTWGEGWATRILFVDPSRPLPLARKPELHSLLRKRREVRLSETANYFMEEETEAAGAEAPEPGSVALK